MHDQALWQGLHEGFIVPNSTTYKFFQGDIIDSAEVRTLTAKDENTLATENEILADQHRLASNTLSDETEHSIEQTASHLIEQTASVRYRFLHDRIQQAAYTLIPEDKKASIHYQIGKRLYQQLTPTAVQTRIFEVVGQLNYDIRHITDRYERETLAQLNLTACKKARTATAYAAVRQYANIGLELLGETPWQQHYSLTLAFHNLAAESAALQGDLAAMEALALKILNNARSQLDQIHIQTTRIQANLAQQNLTDSINIGRHVLQQLGITFPENPTEENTKQAIDELTAIIDDRSIESFADLPPMSHPEMIAAVKIASSLISATFMTASPLYPLLVIAAVRLSLTYGNTETSALAYVSYSVLACNYFHAVEIGVQFGELALKLVEKLDAPEVKPSVLMTGSLFAFHRNTHIGKTLAYFEQGFKAAIDVGNMEFAGYCAGSLGLTSFLSGYSLKALEEETRAYAQSFVQLNHPALADYCRNHWQAALNLIEETPQPHILSGKALQESALLPILKETQALSALFFTYGYKLVLAYLFEEIEAAQAYAQEMRGTLMGGIGSVLEAVFYFYDALIALEHYPQTNSELKKAELMARADQNIATLEQQWAQFAPMNYQHKLELIQAERYRVLNQFPPAMEHYDRAIALAAEHGFIQEAALAQERAAKFYLQWGNAKLATEHMQSAYYSYSHWGAKNKILQLEKRYPQLLAAILQKDTTVLSPSETVMTTVMYDSKDQQDTWLDFPAVIKAAQAISQEIELESLLKELMQIVVADAGAQTGYLLLQETDGWQLMAQATQSEVIAVSIPLSECLNLPQRLIQSVIRTQAVAVFEDLSTVLEFASEPYIIQQQPKSTLCLPINRQGKLIGVLYLENNLTVGAFTRDRIEILQLLTSQAAISLENARLHQQTVNYSQTLETEVASKTQALQK
ncbi:MAG: GAF domain-containing protein, partial [Cyanobacteria bacterium J06649_4]